MKYFPRYHACPLAPLLGFMLAFLPRPANLPHHVCTHKGSNKRTVCSSKSAMRKLGRMPVQLSATPACRCTSSHDHALVIMPTPLSTHTHNFLGTYSHCCSRQSPCAHAPRPRPTPTPSPHTCAHAQARAQAQILSTQTSPLQSRFHAHVIKFLPTPVHMHFWARLCHTPMRLFYNI